MIKKSNSNCTDKKDIWKRNNKTTVIFSDEFCNSSCSLSGQYLSDAEFFSDSDKIKINSAKVSGQWLFKEKL